MVSSTNPVAVGLQRFEEARKSYFAGEANSTEAVLDAARGILAAGEQECPRQSSLGSGHEKPSDFLQRVMWAEVRGSLANVWLSQTN